MASLSLGPLRCQGVAAHLPALADGELRGTLLTAVSHHVDNCAACAAEVEAVASLGRHLRQNMAEALVEPADLAGLADGVVSRIRAEDHESWRGLFARAADDLHWVMVGVGSLVAAFVSALIVSVVVQSALVYRDDSLAGLLASLAAPPGLGDTAMPTAIESIGRRASDDVHLASLAEVNGEGHVLTLVPLPDRDRAPSIDTADAALLIGAMRRMRFEQQERAMTDPGPRRFVWLFSTTEVRGSKKVL